MLFVVKYNAVIETATNLKSEKLKSKSKTDLVDNPARALEAFSNNPDPFSSQMANSTDLCILLCLLLLNF